MTITVLISVTSFLWMLIALMLLQQWIHPLRQVSPGLATFIFILVIVTAPCLLIADIVMTFVDAVFPDNWKNDEDENLRPRP